MKKFNNVRIILILILSFIFVVLTSIFGAQSIDSLALSSKTHAIAFISSQTLPRTTYENSVSECLVGKDNKRIRTKNGEVLRTKPVLVKDDHRKNTFSVIKKIHISGHPADIRYEGVIYPCQMLQIYVLWKENAGKLNSDKKIVQFTYKVLSKIGLGSVNINGRGDEGFIASQASLSWFNMKSFLYTGNYNKDDLKSVALYDLGPYKEQYERNSASFDKQDLLTKYSLLRYLRYSRTLNERDLSYYPIFTIFKTIQSNSFYKEIFRASNNGEKKVKLTYHYSRENTNGDAYFAR